MPRILLVDDDIAEISTVKRVLTRSGHQPILATNTSDAMAVISQAPPQLVVVGATCEGGAALAFVRRLSEDPGTSGIPVILLGDVGDAAPGALQLPRPVDPGALDVEVRARIPATGPAAPPAPGPARAIPRPTAPKARAAGALLGNLAPNPARAATRPQAPHASPFAAGTRTVAPSTAAAEAEAGGAPGDDDGDAERRAAVDALRARAAELRRGGTGRPPTMAAGAPPSNRGRPAVRDPPTRSAPASSPGARLPTPAPRAAVPAIDFDDGGLEEVLRRAEEAERAHLAERRARERQRDRAQVEAAQRAEAEDLAIEKARRAEEQARRARQAEERARTEADERAEADRRAAQEGRRAAEEARRAEEESRRAREAEERARAEEQARAEAEAKRKEEERRRAEAARRAEEERRRAEEERRRAAEAQRRADEEARAREEAEARARSEEQARAEAEARARSEEQARAEAEARALSEEQARAEAEARALSEEQARAEAEARARSEEQAREEADAKRKEEERHRAEAARQAKGAEERARAEADARQKLEEQLEQLRLQMEAQRRVHEQEIATVLERAAAEDQAAEELRRLEEENAREEAAQAAAAAEAARREKAEAELKAAIESAQAEMEALRRRSEEEARRRADAEAQLARMTQGQERLAAEQAALSNPPAPSPEEEMLRRRVQALRRDRSPSAPEFDPPPWLEPSAPPAPVPAAVVPPPAPSAVDAGAEPSRPLPPPPPELREGSLADLPAPRLLVLAARHRLSGRLDFSGEASRSVFFEEGRVVGATSALPEERVEELALRLGLVTRDQHRQLAQAAATLGTRRAAVLLLDRGFLKPTELTPLVRRRTEEVLFGVFADANARFRWIAAEVPPDERTALDRGTLALAVEGVRRRWLAPRVDALLGGPGTLLAPAPGGPPIGELGLSPEERRALALADGLRALDEIVGASPLDPLTTRQVLAALVLVGALTVRIHQIGTPASAAAAAIDLARVREKLDQVRRADYFTILGIGRLCTPHEVREAAERLAAEFEPGRFDGFPDPGLAERLDEILRVVADAREVLSDDRLRSEYLSGLGG